MAEFYVSYEWLGMQYLAHIVAPQRPDTLSFADYEEMHAAMEALGHHWVLTCETPHPWQFAFGETTVWEIQLAQARVLTHVQSFVRLPNGILEW